MKKHFSSRTAHLMFATLTAVGALCITGSATAQVAGGTTTVDTSVTESTKLAMGWSVKKTLLGKTIYTEVGEKVGKGGRPDHLARTGRVVRHRWRGWLHLHRSPRCGHSREPDQEPGRQAGDGRRHQRHDQGHAAVHLRLDTAERDWFVAAAEADIAKGKERVADLEKRGSAATTDVKAKIDQQIAAPQGDLKAAESKLAELKKVTAVR